MANFEVIKIFVGAKEFKEQDKLLQMRKAQGWTIGVGSTDTIIADALNTAKGKNVIINGAFAGGCVSDVARLALLEGALSVIIPLSQVKTGNEVDQPLFDRALAIVQFFQYLAMTEYFVDPRLIITPKRIWDTAKNIQNNLCYT